MSQLVKESQLDSRLREKAIDLLQATYAQNYQQFAEAVEEYCRRNLRVIMEADEVLTRPEAIVARITERGSGWGDCDDVSMLGAALLSVVGFSVRFKAVYPAEDGSFQHVFIEYQIPNGDGAWVPMDATIRTIPVYPDEVLIEDV